MPAMRAQASAVYIGIITIVASAGPVIVSCHIILDTSLPTLWGNDYSLKVAREELCSYRFISN